MGNERAWGKGLLFFVVSFIERFDSLHYGHTYLIKAKNKIKVKRKDETPCLAWVCVLKAASPVTSTPLTSAWLPLSLGHLNYHQGRNRVIGGGHQAWWTVITDSTVLKEQKYVQYVQMISWRVGLPSGYKQELLHASVLLICYLLSEC